MHNGVCSNLCFLTGKLRRYQLLLILRREKEILITDNQFTECFCVATKMVILNQLEVSGNIVDSSSAKRPTGFFPLSSEFVADNSP